MEKKIHFQESRRTFGSLGCLMVNQGCSFPQLRYPASRATNSMMVLASWRRHPKDVCSSAWQPWGHLVLSGQQTLCLLWWPTPSPTAWENKVMGIAQKNILILSQQLSREIFLLFHPQESLAVFRLFVKLPILAKGLSLKKNSYYRGQWVVWNHFI